MAVSVPPAVKFLRNVLRHVEGRGVAQIADHRRHARIDADVNANAVGVVVDVVVEIAVEVAVGVEVAVAVQIAVAVAVQIAVQIGGNLRLGLTLALEAQLALAFALALTLILILIVRIPRIDTHDVSPPDVKTHPSLRRIADLLRLRSTNDLRQPFTSNKIDLDFDCSGDRFETNDPQSRKAISPDADRNQKSTSVSRCGRLPLPAGVDPPTQQKTTIFDGKVNRLLGKVAATRRSDRLTDGGIAAENGRFWNLTGPPSGERWLTSSTPP